MLNEIQLATVDLNLLVLFNAVRQHGHVGQAAAELGLSPSAVSHGLRRLRGLFSDPLFLRTPKGVVPSDRAEQLAAPISDILARIKSVMASGAAFDAATSTRRFTLGMPDSAAAALLPTLLSQLREHAPHVDLTLRQVFPQDALGALESRAIDLALAPFEAPPARFVARPLLDERFVIAARRGHPLLKRLTLERYAAAQHVLTSLDGDPHGFVDQLLQKRGLTRRVALVVPSFLLALAALEHSELVAAIPVSLVKQHQGRFGIASVEPPLPLRSEKLSLIATRAGLDDAGLAWLFELLPRGIVSVRQKRNAR
jgi:DNA-binding transcriptional LysR family regulator